MKDYLRQVLGQTPDPLRARLMVREYLQARLLQHLQDAGAGVTWAFQGGTCLRFLFNLPRFSEDLDFALVRSGAQDSFRTFIMGAKAMFEAETYAVTATLNDQKTVHAAFIGFPGLLFDLGLSPHRAEALSIKIELDTKPPDGAQTTTTVVRRHVMLRLLHHDKASLLVGKLHALLARPHTKGRDLYDLVWYLSDRSWPQPNLVLLNNALEQTRWPGPHLDDKNWRSVLKRRLNDVNWPRGAADVKPFLERQEDLSLLTPETVVRLIDGQ